MGKKLDLVHKALIKLILILIVFLLVLAVISLCAVLCVYLNTPALIVNIILVAIGIFLAIYLRY